MAKEPDAEATVRATVVRGSFWTVDKDGKRREVTPGNGKDSEVTVTGRQLAASVGVLVKSEHAEAEMRKVAQESIAPSTPTADATSPPSAEGAAPASSSRRERWSCGFY